MIFQPGQRVVCINDVPYEHSTHKPLPSIPLKRGRIYTVKGSCSALPEISITLIEQPGLWTAYNPQTGDVISQRPDEDLGWMATRFAPIDPRPESLEIFHKILNRVTIPENI